MHDHDARARRRAALIVPRDPFRMALSKRRSAAKVTSVILVQGVVVTYLAFCLVLDIGDAGDLDGLKSGFVREIASGWSIIQTVLSDDGGPRTPVDPAFMVLYAGSLITALLALRSLIDVLRTNAFLDRLEDDQEGTRS